MPGLIATPQSGGHGAASTTQSANRKEIDVLRLTALIALAATALALAGSTSAAPVKLTVTVGPGHTISLKKGSARVATLKRGTYRITVNDRSSEHNFHLRGPVSRMFSSVGWTGSKTISVTLKPGRYTYVCDPHADEMLGRFRVT
jgi:plastocyanin